MIGVCWTINMMFTVGKVTKFLVKVITSSDVIIQGETWTEIVRKMETPFCNFTKTLLKCVNVHLSELCSYRVTVINIVWAARAGKQNSIYWKFTRISTDNFNFVCYF